MLVYLLVGKDTGLLDRCRCEQGRDLLDLAVDKGLWSPRSFLWYRGMGRMGRWCSGMGRLGCKQVIRVQWGDYKVAIGVERLV